MNNRPDNLEYVSIRETKGFVTAMDRYDLRDDFAFRIRGFLNTERGYVGKRGYGTQQRYSLLPYKPNTGKAIVSVADNGAGLIRLEVTGHGRATGDIIIVHDMAGTGAATSNGIWTVTINGANHLDLQNSTYDAGLVYTVTNAKVRVPVSIRRGARFYDKDAGIEHEIVVAVDESNKTRIYVWDGTVWQEMTRKLNAKINGAPPAPADTTTPTVVTIDTITEEDGSAYTLPADELIGWVAYNATTATASFIVDNAALTLSVVHDVTQAAYSWVNDNDLVLFRSKVVYTDFNFLNGVNPHVRFLPIDAQKKCTVLYADNSGVGLVRKDPVQVRKHTVARSFFGSTTGGTKASGTIDGRTATHLDLVYINGFAIIRLIVAPTIDVFHNGVGAYGTLREAVFQNPDIANLVDVAAIGGDNNNVTITAKNVGTDGNAITLAISGSDPQFIISGATLTGGTNGIAGPGLVTLPIGFYLEKAYFTTKFLEVGSTASPRLGTNPAEGIVIGDGIRVTLTYSELTSALQYRHARLYVIPIYRDGQFGQPILKVFLSGSGASKYASVSIAIQVDPSRLSLDITGFQLYIAAETNGTPTQADWIDNAEDYLLKQEALMTSGFSYNNGLEYPYYTVITSGLDSEYASLEASEAVSIVAQLNHTPFAQERTPLRPLYAVQASNGQASIIVVDQDDNVLRTSNYNGDGTHEDDMYPEAALSEPDLAGARSKLKLLLLSKGELFGIGFVNGLVAALKESEVELKSLQGGGDRSLPADVHSRDSILMHDYGLSWAGARNAYLIPQGSFEIFPLFNDIKNFFDGSELIDDKSASYITDAYRSAVISGWDPTFGTIWFHVQANKDIAKGGGSEYLNLMLSMDQSTLATNFSVRVLNIGSDRQPVRYFDRAKDKTMVIGYATGILEYPILTGSRRFEDDVRSDGVTAGRGIPTSTLIHVGSVASLSNLKTVYCIIVGFTGESVNKMGLATLNFYVDDLVLFDTKKFRIDGQPEVIYIQPIGGMTRLWVEVLLPESSLDNFKELNLSELTFGVVPQ